MVEYFNELGIPLYHVSGKYPTSLAIKKHPDLIPYLKTIDPPRINKENREALLLYNYYIAQDLYDLTIEFEKANAIIPTPIMRHAFLSHVIKENSIVMEIGTGASAIIAMLAAKCFNSHVYASDIDSDYLQIAKKNIRLNGLDSKITLYQSHGGLIKDVFPPDLKVDYIISNPPYYDKVLSPKFLWGGKAHELISSGETGEEFIVQMIHEGWHYLKTPGCIAFIIPKTRISTLNSIEKFLNDKNFYYDIIGILAGNRTRYVFRIFKTALEDTQRLAEML